MRWTLRGSSVLRPAGPLVLLLAAVLGPLGPTVASPAGPREPIAQLLGLSPGMPEAKAHRILSRLGKRIEGEEEAEEAGDAGIEREVWRLHDSRYAWIQLAVDARHQVRAIQAHLRPGPGMRYSEIGDLGKARRLGFTILEWEVRASAGRPGRRITARGADSVFATSVALAAMH